MPNFSAASACEYWIIDVKSSLLKKSVFLLRFFLRLGFSMLYIPLPFLKVSYVWLPYCCMFWNCCCLIQQTQEWRQVPHLILTSMIISKVRSHSAYTSLWLIHDMWATPSSSWWNCICILKLLVFFTIVKTRKYSTTAHISNKEQNHKSEMQLDLYQIKYNKCKNLNVAIWTFCALVLDNGIFSCLRLTKMQQAKPATNKQDAKEKEAKNTNPAPPSSQQQPEKSTVKTYRPPDGSTAVLCIHTTPTLMKKLAEFLRHFDRPPQQLFLEFVFVEVNEDDVAQFRYKLDHPLLQSIYGATMDGGSNLMSSPLDDDDTQQVLNNSNNNFTGAGGRTRRLRNMPSSLTPKMWHLHFFKPKTAKRWASKQQRCQNFFFKRARAYLPAATVRKMCSNCASKSKVMHPWRK